MVGDKSDLKVGELVTLYTTMRKPGLSDKLIHRYFGPYKITKRIGEIDVEIVPRPHRHRASGAGIISMYRRRAPSKHQTKKDTKLV